MSRWFRTRSPANTTLVPCMWRLHLPERLSVSRFMRKHEKYIELENKISA